MSRGRLLILMLGIVIVSWAFVAGQDSQPTWLPGDSHIHSQWSTDFDETTQQSLIGVDGRYSTPINAYEARKHGLAWMVTTDHGGPNHAKLNLKRAYAELTVSRKLVPDLLQFYGMELNMPAMDHHTLIIPNDEREAEMLFDIESQFDSAEAWPANPSRNTEEQTRRALEHMRALPMLPLVFANHPSRSATGVGVYGGDEPREFRANNDVAPEVYRGMEGAPGHQAAALGPDGKPKIDKAGNPAGFRGSYSHAGAHTFGGFDQMTARVGGLWDSMLGEGRRFWIVATSDSHAHYTDPTRPGSDFWPGEYQKTFVHATHSYRGVLEGLRNGRIFVAAGDLISELDLSLQSGTLAANIGGTLVVDRGRNVTVTIRFRDPAAPNARGENPRVSRLDVIAGDVRGPASDRSSDRNDTSRVIARFGPAEWTQNGEMSTMSLTLPPVDKNFYIRIRGTNTNDLEPPMDTAGENPWADLWFYSNPVFIEIGQPSRSTP